MHAGTMIVGGDRKCPLMVCTPVQRDQKAALLVQGFGKLGRYAADADNDPLGLPAQRLRQQLIGAGVLARVKDQRPQGQSVKRLQ